GDNNIPRKGELPSMTLINRYPRIFPFALILFVLLLLPVQSSVIAKKRHADPPRRKAARVERGKNEKGKKLSARERRAAKRNERLTARDTRRASKVKLSKRELRRQAREEAALVKALERKLH